MRNKCSASGDSPKWVKNKRRKRDGKKEKKKKKERPKVGNKNGQLRIATPPRVAHAKPPGSIDWVGGWVIKLEWSWV